MPVYAADFLRTLSTTASWGSFGASSGTQTRRIKLLYMIGGHEATPADAAIQFTAMRYTAAGTSTAVIPTKLDPADPAMLGVAGENHTVEPTYVTGPPALIVLNFSYHQRQGFVYYAPPGAEITVAAINAEGVGFQTDTISSGTPAGTMTVHLLE